MYMYSCGKMLVTIVGEKLSCRRMYWENPFLFTSVHRIWMVYSKVLTDYFWEDGVKCC